MNLSELKSLATAAALNARLDPNLVHGVCAHESKWDVWAARFEPAFFSRYIEKMTGLSDTEKHLRATSFGLMQVMGQVAREKGFDDPYLTALCDPQIGLIYGCKKLKECMDREGGRVREALLRYNGGGDPHYPDYVFKEMEHA